MRTLITADLHLTDSPKDRYRWSVFDWFNDLCAKEDVGTLILAGDMFHRKDRHSARLVNEFIYELCCLAEDTQVIVVMGNHDYVDPDCPFLGFVDHFPHIKWIRNPEEITLGCTAVILPHTRNPEEWPHDVDLTDVQLVILHQPFMGVKVGGVVLPFTTPTSLLDEMGLEKDAVVVSGDIHVPQKVGRVIYVGAPHPINFGDDWHPRVFLFDSEARTPGRRLKEIRRKPGTWVKKVKLTITDLDSLVKVAADLTKGDQLKVEIVLRREDFHEWDERKQAVVAWADGKGIHLDSVTLRERKGEARKRKIKSAPPTTSLDMFDSYVKARRIDKPMAQAGRSILEKLC